MTEIQRFTPPTRAVLLSELKIIPFEFLADDEYSLKLKFIAGSSAFNDENIIKCTFK